jgi:hypothetical protein
VICVCLNLTSTVVTPAHTCPLLHLPHMSIVTPAHTCPLLHLPTHVHCYACPHSPLLRLPTHVHCYACPHMSIVMPAPTCPLFNLPTHVYCYACPHMSIVNTTLLRTLLPNFIWQPNLLALQKFCGTHNKILNVELRIQNRNHQDNSE